MQEKAGTLTIAEVIEMIEGPVGRPEKVAIASFIVLYNATRDVLIKAGVQYDDLEEMALRMCCSFTESIIDQLFHESPPVSFNFPDEKQIKDFIVPFLKKM